jgi:RNA polymerase sigma-70 factor (ECF subfamily)
VEEIVQDVFVNFWTKAPSLDLNGNVKAYLYATLRNKVLHELRTAATRAFYAEKIKLLTRQDKECDSLDMLYARENERYINHLISTLSPQCKEAFLLSRYEHLSYKEIAQRMRLSVNTVEKHVSKALRILKNKLSEHGNIAIIILFILSFYIPSCP